MNRIFACKRAAAVLACAAIGLAACGQQPAENTQQAAAPAEPRGFLVFVTNETSGDLTIIDGATNAVVGTVPLGKRPRGVRVSEDGKTLYVALSGSPMAPPGVDEAALPPADKSADGIGVFDIATRTLSRVMRGVSDPEQSAVGPNGKLYIASEDTGTAVIMNTADGTVLSNLPVGGEPEGVGASPDRRYVYMTSEEDHQVSVIDTATDKVVATLKVGERPRDAAFSPDGSRAYVTGEFDATVTLVNARTHQVQRSVKIEGETILPMGAVVSPDGSRVYVTTGRGGTLAVLDGSSLNVISQVKVGQRPWGLAISPDGRFVYTANGPSNDISVVDTQSLAVVATVKVGDRPWGVAVAPAP